MRGILAAAAYVPYNRLQRSKITQTLGSGGGRGTRAVAAYDEDTTTMGVEAARLALRNAGGVTPTAIFYATADPAYLDKNNATAIQAALDLPGNVGAYDACGSARSSMGALVSSANYTWGPALLVSSDTRTGLAGSGDEANCGDAAAAVLFGDDTQGNVIAELVGGAMATAEFLDRWRTPGNSFTKGWEERFGEAAYSPVIESAVKDAYESSGIKPEEIAKVVMTGLAARAVRSAAKFVGVGPDKFVDTQDGTIGNTGGTHPLMLLAAALEGASAGDVIMVVHAADGCDVAIFKVTEHIKAYQSARPVAQQVAEGSDAIDYAKFLTWKGMLTREPPRRPDPDRPGAPPSLRAQDWKFAFVGSQCQACTARNLPPARVCVKCQAVDQMERVNLADVPGTIATFTIDRLAFSLSPPMVAAVVDFDGGGRYPLEMADCAPEEVKIGMRVEMTFRRLYTADGIHNYFWKARPIR